MLAALCLGCLAGIVLVGWLIGLLFKGDPQ